MISPGMGSGEVHRVSILKISGLGTTTLRAPGCCCVKCGPWITSVDIDQELVRNAELKKEKKEMQNFRSHHRPLDQNLTFNQIHYGFIGTLRFEKHYSRILLKKLRGSHR